MSTVKLVWTTPNGVDLIAYMARVSNPGNQNNPDSSAKLLKYLVRNKHWSPFEMVSMCVEIDTTRDIARQILRHRSFSFQEFSTRYAVAGASMASEARLQDTKNRQNSFETDDAELQSAWHREQEEVLARSRQAYDWALGAGIAKEVARRVLPEGLTASRMYMNGTLRSWIHYVELRCDPATQKEHREVADQIKEIMFKEYPVLAEVLAPHASVDVTAQGKAAAG